MANRTTRDTLVERIDFGAQEGGPREPTEAIEISFDRSTFVLGDRLDNLPGHAAVEIWSKNRIYLVDSAMTCIEVRSRRTGRAEKHHRVLGARLAGGQRKYGKTMHVARPLPVPGTEAVFQSGRQVAGLTSVVERVIVHVLITSFVMDEDGAWDDVTSVLLLPPHAPRRKENTRR